MRGSWGKEGESIWKGGLNASSVVGAGMCVVGNDSEPE